MNEVIYREIEKKDYDAVMLIMNQGFGLYRYVDDPKTLQVFLNLYLQSCLSEKTFSCVAEKGGKVVGVILGKANSRYTVVSHLPNILSVLYYNTIMAVKSARYKVSTNDYKNLHKIYRDFLKNRKGEFDGVLTLFAVSEDCRGLGVGKNLLSRLRDYLKENGTKRVYLYTDTTCNYGFYDSQGFERLEQQPLIMTSEHKPMKMTVFLYGYDVR